ncbi:four helix bundle protein [Niabella yanshanensis]|uniref:four helix bundle protein n=1 Tax=Niabella yanshanensis TaxID=577386 RepID=UPI001B8766E5
MKENNLIADKSFSFGLCSQVLNSGTSIGANVEEAIGQSSRKDFGHKLEKSYREARYWLRLLRES